ncbi:hypothetical protein OIU85_029434 [Salix viminalis]|uniref:DUF1221 domain-containing protein n=1 Tax=Salix viminalis TaxID=40686 RepID=A0A9Q0QBS6_SALVM|nr:hypothetical protein OIU85_029434 [Salix viminalis]
MGYSSLIRLEKGPSDSLLIAVFIFLTAELVKVKKEGGSGFRQTGEVLGSLKALMVLQDDIQINQKQCCLLLNFFCLAFKTIAEEIKQNLKLEEKNTKWRPLEEPLREVYRVFKEGELYVRRCLDNKDWWGKAISLHQNKDSVEFHIHNLLSCFPAVIEAIEIAGEISGLDQEEMTKKRAMLVKKYDRGWSDPKLFQWNFGKQYLIPREICRQMERAMREDRWLLIDTIKEKRRALPPGKSEHRLGELLLRKLNVLAPANGKLPPSSIFVRSRRLPSEEKTRWKSAQGNSMARGEFCFEAFLSRS